MYPSSDRGPAEGVPARTLLLAAIGVAGVTAGITMMFLGMRAVMDVGGACADGGPYVSAQHCPDGAPAALFLGILCLFVFGGLGMVFGPRIGGLWSAIPLLAWCGLFLALGWNFLDYGMFNPPAGAGVVAGWLLPGIIFVLMGGVPMAGILLAARSGSLESNPILMSFSGGIGSPVPRPRRRPSSPEAAAAVVTDDAPDGLDPVRHLEKLAGLRSQGLLSEAEYETAKAAVVRQMESSS